jgi:hypothetical protein
LIVGGFEDGRIIAYSPTAANQIQIVKGVYYDSEIIPTEADIRQISIDQIPLLVLSPEFIAISKLSYPNIHHPLDFQDVLALNQCKVLQNSDYLCTLLAQTSVGKLINASEILGLKSQDDLQSLADSIHRQLIRRFLRWDRVHVDALTPLQLFVLLDIGDELINLSLEKHQFIDIMLARTSLIGRDREIAKLALYLLVMDIPDQYIDVLHVAKFQAIIHRWLALIPEHSTSSLSRAKIALLTLRYLACIEHIANIQFSPIWNADTLVRIMQRILFDDPSRFVLFMLIKSFYNDLKAGRNLMLDCDKLLHVLATPTSEFLIT